MKLEIKDKTIVGILKYLKIKNKTFQKIVAFLEIFFERAEDNHLFLIAAGIAFNILLYLMPLLLVAVYFVNVIFDVNSVAKFLIDTIMQVLPPTQSTTSLIESLLKEIYIILGNSKIAGIIGAVSLLWLSSILLSSLRSGLNTIFKIYTPHIFIIYRLKDIFLIITMTVLLLFSSFVFPVISVLSTGIQDVLPDTLKPIFSQLYIKLFTFSTSFILFYTMFRFVPNKKMPFFIRILSTFFCVVFVELSRYIFAWYVSGVTSYGNFYGAYAILASLSVWVYYLTLIILFSAELSKLIYDLRQDKKNVLIELH